MVRVSPASGGLSACLHSSNGISPDEALKRADLHLCQLHNTVQKGLAESIEAIGELVGASSSAMPAENLKRLYQLSDGIYGVAGSFEREALGKVAHSLCDLVQDLSNENQWDAGAVGLHFDAMRLLQHAPKLDQEAQDDLLNGLHRVVRALRKKHCSSNGVS